MIWTTPVGVVITQTQMGFDISLPRRQRFALPNSRRQPTEKTADGDDDYLLLLLSSPINPILSSELLMTLILKVVQYGQLKYGVLEFPINTYRPKW